MAWEDSFGFDNDFNTDNNVGRARGSKADGRNTRGGGSNTSYGVDPRTGNVVQVGAPSRMGGMLTTAAGYNLNRAYDRLNGGLGLNSYGISDKRSPFYQAYYTNNQNNVTGRADARRTAHEKTALAIANSNLSPFEKIMATKDLAAGRLGALDEYGIDTTQMRATHHGGGLLGDMFDWGKGADDVQTMSETEKELGKVDPDNPMGYASMGFLGTVAAPAIGQKLYEITKSPTTAIAGMQGVKTAGKMATPKTNGMPGYVAGVASLAEVPGATPVGQMMGVLDRAANLNYAGYTGSPKAPNSSYADNGRDSEPWLYWI